MGRQNTKNWTLEAIDLVFIPSSFIRIARAMKPIQGFDNFRKK